MNKKPLSDFEADLACKAAEALPVKFIIATDGDKTMQVSKGDWNLIATALIKTFIDAPDVALIVDNCLVAAEKLRTEKGKFKLR